MDVICDQVSKTIVNVPVEKINLTEWLFTLRDHEYQACSVAHIGAGASLSVEGKRISINVEMVAGNLLVQHYREDVSEKDHCRVNSVSDSISPAGKTKLGITWELKVTEKSEDTCELSNRVMVSFTDHFLTLLKQANITDLDVVKQGMAQNVKAHNEEETPLFGKDIERKARSGVWS